MKKNKTRGVSDGSCEDADGQQILHNRGFGRVRVLKERVFRVEGFSWCEVHGRNARPARFKRCNVPGHHGSGSLMYKGGLVCYGRRNGFEVGNGQKADQFVLVYKEGTDVISHLSGLDCEEVPVDA